MYDGVLFGTYNNQGGPRGGEEFISVIRAILLVGGGQSLLSEESREAVAAVTTPKTLHVFTTPT